MNPQHSYLRKCAGGDLMEENQTNTTNYIFSHYHAFCFSAIFTAEHYTPTTN